MNITMNKLEALAVCYLHTVQLQRAHGGHDSQRRVQAAVALKHTAPIYKPQ